MRGSMLTERPLPLMRRLGAELDRMFEDFDFARPVAFTAPARSFEWLPAVELLQKPDQFLVKVELPGLTKADVKIEVVEGYLTIEGERKQEKTDKREGSVRTERSYGSFYRAIALPEGANADLAKATFNKGVLEIEVPVAATKPATARRLPIEEPEDKKVLVGA